MAILSLFAVLVSTATSSQAISTIAPGAASGTITPIVPCVTIPVDLTRDPSPGSLARYFDVTIELSAELVLCSTPPTIVVGTWLPSGFFNVTDLGSNRYRVEGSYVGNSPCGSGVSGQLFTVSVGSASPSATSGTLRVTAAQLLACDGTTPLPVAASATPTTVPITPPFPPPGPVTLTVTPFATGNGADGTINLRLTWLPNIPVEIYRASFGNEPEYDDPPGGALLHRINFQPSSAPLVPGFDADFGDLFDAGRGYGWNVQVTTTARAQLPANNPQANFARRFNDNPSGTWEIVVPNGIYQVHVVCGDAQTSSRNVLRLEGTSIFDNVLANGGSFITDTRLVTVNDNRLSMQIGGVHPTAPVLSETKVCFIEIGTAPPGGSGGVEPSLVTAFPPPAGYTLLTGVPVLDWLDDEPTNRDEYYYVAYAVNGANRSGPSNRVAAINYHLGDIFYDPSVSPPGPVLLECLGDNRVNEADLSFLAAFYNSTIAPGFVFACLDIGPTSTGTVFGRPLTDNLIDFKDLLILSQNFNAVSKPRTAHPASGRDVLALDVVEDEPGSNGPLANLTLEGAGRLRGMAARLEWNPQVVQPVGASAAAHLASQGGVAFPAGPGGVDLALLGARTTGLAGSGTLAQVRFERIGPGDPGIVIANVDARDLTGGVADIEIASRGRGGVSAPRVSAVLDNTPNPFNPTTRIRFALAERGLAELAIYSIDGRLVRQLRRETLDVGVYEATWDGTDASGARVSSGVYYAELRSAAGKSSRPLVLLK